MPASPKVSIILPTCNRAEVLSRAVDSVRRQTCLDWELIVVDDGATDGTGAWLATLRDERIHVLRQANAGVHHARNAGLRAARGEYIAFLDADDEWYPHFLALTTAFLDAHAQQMFVTTEFHNHGQVFDRAVVPAMARQARALGLGLYSTALLQPRDDDDLRVDRRCEPVGAWGQRIVHRLGMPAARVYRGSIFTRMRWGDLNWLPVTLLRREALATVGEFSTATRSAADVRFLALLCQHFPAAMIAVPSACKHENAADGRRMPCDHLASGAGAHRFGVNKLKYFGALFHARAAQDPELQVIRRHRQARPAGGQTGMTGMTGMTGLRGRLMSAAHKLLRLVYLVRRTLAGTVAS
ncbi:glycosyltransferase family 2 protein [Sphaerotilus microaerophilus]|nr:glycosyltransferase family 2 protein [Sphaerotilus sp. FB-5]